jgi:hypothetical protein
LNWVGLSLYDEVGRHYDFELDAWTIPEELGYFELEKGQEEVSSTSSSGERVMMIQNRSKFKFEFSVDAFYYGNWTRFCNHRCYDYNAAPRTVYIDDIDPRRPLWVFFATRDIHPGEEITIAYHTEASEIFMDDKSRRPGWKATYKAQLNARRQRVEKHFRCYCQSIQTFSTPENTLS